MIESEILNFFSLRAPFNNLSVPRGRYIDWLTQIETLRSARGPSARTFRWDVWRHGGVQRPYGIKKTCPEFKIPTIILTVMGFAIKDGDSGEKGVRAFLLVFYYDALVF